MTPPGGAAAIPGGTPVKPRIGLALGGGSARGLAHILMLEAFDELGVKPSVIAGTSMGAILGACYAAGLTAREIRSGVEALLASRAAFFRRLAGQMRGNVTTLWSARQPGVIDIVTLLEMLLPDALRGDFAGLKIPFVAVAADFYAMQQVVLDSGPIIPALGASAALPTITRPVRLGERLLIDGGYINPVPFDVIAPRADLVVAVDVTGAPQRRADGTTPRAVELISGATQILFRAVVAEKVQRVPPDVMVRPEVGSFGTLDYFRASDIFAAAEPAKHELKNALRQRLGLAA